MSSRETPTTATVDFASLRQIDICGESIKLEFRDSPMAEALAPRLLRHGPGTAVIAVRPGIDEADDNAHVRPDAIAEILRMGAAASLRTVIDPQAQLTVIATSMVIVEPLELDEQMINCHGALIRTAGDFAEANGEIRGVGGRLLGHGVVRFRVHLEYTAR